MNKYIIVSDAVPAICQKFTDMGYKLIYTESVDEFICYEQKHADMQCCKIENRIFVLSACKNLGNQLKKLGFNVSYTTNDFSGEYPHNVLLNTKIIGNYLIGKIGNLDRELLEFCKNKNHTLINVNQGYSACSILKIKDNAIITADPSIYKALNKTNIDVLKISEGNIELFGAGENTYGFIGGASANINSHTVLFFGDITKHPDYSKINKFCEEYDIKIDYIRNLPLTDIGSAILLNI